MLGGADSDAHHVRWVMRRLDGMIYRYAEQLETRGLAAGTIRSRVAELPFEDGKVRIWSAEGR